MCACIHVKIDASDKFDAANSFCFPLYPIIEFYFSFVSFQDDNAKYCIRQNLILYREWWILRFLSISHLFAAQRASSLFNWF